MTSKDRASSGSRAPSLAEVFVSEVMHQGVFSCPADTALPEVARLMSREHIHAVVVSGIKAEGSSRDGDPWGVVSDLDLVGAALAGARDVTAGEIAAMEFLTIGAGQTLEQVAHLMVDHEVHHLVVLDLQRGHAVGVLSTRDVADAIGSREG